MQDRRSAFEGTFKIAFERILDEGVFVVEIVVNNPRRHTGFIGHIRYPKRAYTLHRDDGRGGPEDLVTPFNFDVGSRHEHCSRLADCRACARVWIHSDLSLIMAWFRVIS